MEWNSLLTLFGSLGGIGALVAALVNIGKTVGWVKDNQAPTWVTGLNLAGLILVFVLGIFAPDMKIAGVDQFAGQLAIVLVTVFGFVWQILASKLTHSALKGTVLVGKSFTVEATRAKSFQADLLQRKNI